MRNSKTARTFGYLSLASLFSATALSCPFAVLAQQTNAAAQTPSAGVGTTSPTPVSDALLTHTLTVTVRDGVQAPRTFDTKAQTVGDALAAAGITFGKDDRIVPRPSTPLAAGQKIVITRVHFEAQTETASIPFKTVFKMSRAVPPGKIQSGQHGVPGILAKTYNAGFVNGKRTCRDLVAMRVAKQPQDQETLAGIRVREARALPSRSGSYRRMQCFSMVATGYSPYEGSSVGRCATGMRAGYGVVAVDPRLIPLRSRLYVEGYGYAVAGDTGGAIKGHRIDLGHTTHSEASNVGRRRVTVWLLSPAR